jgi:hypothetical protein
MVACNNFSPRRRHLFHIRNIRAADLEAGGFCVYIFRLEDIMHKAPFRLLLLLIAMCASATVSYAQTGFCVQCSCHLGVCSCPTCVDHFPGQCGIVNCQNGFSCCPVTPCGSCQCADCSPARCIGLGKGCSTPAGCPLVPATIENVEANNHLQPWMVDSTLPAQIAEYSKTWSVIVARLQRDFSDTSVPLASRRTLLIAEIPHIELGFPEYKQSVVVESTYNAQKGGWVLRLIRGLADETSKADILVFMPQAWSLHREEPNTHIADGKIVPMAQVLDFPTDKSVEAKAAAALARAVASVAQSR